MKRICARAAADHGCGADADVLDVPCLTPHTPFPPLRGSGTFHALHESGEGGGGVRRQGAPLPPPASYGNLSPLGAAASPSEQDALPGEGLGVGALGETTNGDKEACPVTPGSVHRL